MENVKAEMSQFKSRAKGDLKNKDFAVFFIKNANNVWKRHFVDWYGQLFQTSRGTDTKISLGNKVRYLHAKFLS